jgi:hypothetical protein
MEQTLPRDDHAPSNIKSWQLWFSLLGGIVVWSLHLMIVYPLTSLNCEWGWFETNTGGLSGLQGIQIVVTVIAAVITGIGGLFAWRNRQQLSQVSDNHRHRFMANMGFGLNILFTSLIVVSLVPILTLPPCG